MIFKCCLLFYLLLIVSCSGVSKEEKQIEAKVRQLYSIKQSIYAMELDSTLFDSELLDLLLQIRSIRERHLEIIAKSEYPTDKPIMIEGSVFSGLLDGYSGYKMLTIAIANNLAEVVVRLEYPSEPIEQWQDKITLIKENEVWKIRNITFSTEISSDADLKNRFDSVILQATEIPELAY